MGLNGWQRLWVIISGLTFALVVVFVFSFHESTNLVDDPQVLALITVNEVTTAEIEGIGKVDFPNDLTLEQISAHVKQGMSSTPSSVVAIAEDLLKERTQKRALEARNKNQIASSENLHMWIVGVSAWLVFIAVIYIMGLAIGWVRSGFNSSQTP
jgi:ATP-dependent Zn protease